MSYSAGRACCGGCLRMTEKTRRKIELELLEDALDLLDDANDLLLLMFQPDHTMNLDAVRHWRTMYQELNTRVQ